MTRADAESAKICAVDLSDIGSAEPRIFTLHFSLNVFAFHSVCWRGVSIQ